MSATSAARAHARMVARDETLGMTHPGDNTLRAAVSDGAHQPLRPTIYRPSGSRSLRPSLTRVTSGEEIEAEIFHGSALARVGIDPPSLK